MLVKRIITALVLLLVLIPTLLVERVWPFAIVTLVLIAAAGWEWCRLCGVRGFGAWVYGAIVAAGAAGVLYMGWIPLVSGKLWLAALPLWLVGGAMALSGGVEGWRGLRTFVRLLLGLMVLWMAWLAIAVAKTRGVNFLLSVFCLVWMADIAAYFSGKLFGEHKLAPTISPGKSIEGAFGGLVGVFIMAFAWLLFDARGDVDSRSLYSQLLSRQGQIGFWLSILFLTGFSIVGDLFESLIKRAAGAKDSSQLLPGHGGVLDRIDALLPVCPLALALLSI